MINTDLPFAIIQREDSPTVHVLTGNILRLDLLEQIPKASGTARGARRFDTLSLVPFSQIREKGFEALAGDEKILCLEITNQKDVPIQDLIEALPEHPIAFDVAPQFDESDDDYVRAVRKIIDDEIGQGRGANFVHPRTCRGKIANFGPGVGLSILRKLLCDDYGTYWKFAFFDGHSMFVGSTPELHLCVENGTVTMNPISGTFRKTCGQVQSEKSAAFARFLQDPKEIYELFMVVDEELKMMTEMCPLGGKVHGPMLREMSQLIHTEYRLQGRSEGDVIELLRKSLFAATVTGSPVKSACDVISRYEKTPRRYYAAAMALIGSDAEGNDYLDSPILIRTVEVGPDGSFQFRVGASLVRDSVPEEELAETNAKGKAVLAALCRPSAGGSSERAIFGRGAEASQRESQLLKSFSAIEREHLEVLLSERNKHLSSFWFQAQPAAAEAGPLCGKRLLFIDNEDGFVHMLAHLFRSLGASVDVMPWTHPVASLGEHDALLVGPGPGDPRDSSCAKMDSSIALIKRALAQRHPLLAICLGHQLLCRVLGLDLIRGKELHQGMQSEISLFGTTERVGFYNTFWALDGATTLPVEVAKSNDNRLYGLRGRGFASYQFHAESVLSPNGATLLEKAMEHALASSREVQ